MLNHLGLYTILVLLLLQGCVVAPSPPQRPGPPDHAPAHGYRQKYQYNYYPEASVYFDVNRRIFFYLDGGWRSASYLPRELNIRLGAPVAIEMELAAPYERYDEHRKAFPPGRGKQKKTKQ